MTDSTTTWLFVDMQGEYVVDTANRVVTEKETGKSHDLAGYGDAFWVDQYELGKKTITEVRVRGSKPEFGTWIDLQSLDGKNPNVNEAGGAFIKEIAKSSENQEWLKKHGWRFRKGKLIFPSDDPDEDDDQV